MRLIHLMPPPGSQPDHLERALAVVGALSARGHASRSWSPSGSGASAVLELTTLLRGLDEVDLVHNHAGLWALPALVAGGLPVVTSLCEPLGEAELAYLAALEPAPILMSYEVGCESEPVAVPVAVSIRASSSADETASTLEALYAETLGRWRTEVANGRYDERPWGRYWVLDDQPTFKVKRITVDPGGRLSYQRHRRRSEHWLFVAGRAKVTLDGSDHDLGAGDDIRIPAGCAHRVQNVGPEPVTFVEVQSGDYFGEDDIERLSDDYGRAPA